MTREVSVESTMRMYGEQLNRFYRNSGEMHCHTHIICEEAKTHMRVFQ